MLNPEQMEALGYEIKRDGPLSLVILRGGAVAGHIVRSKRDKTLWRAVTVSGELRHCRSISSGIEHIVALTR